MCRICVTENGSVIGTENGKIKINYLEKETVLVPREIVEGIAIYGKSQMTASCIQFCLERGIPVSFFTQTGKYYGSLTSMVHNNIEREKKQIMLFQNEEFSLELSKLVINAKINNQLVVARRYSKNNSNEEKEKINKLKEIRWKSKNAINKNQLLGYEGIASRYYFHILSSVINKDFYFSNRNKRPALDPFNAMLNLGYSILSKEICGVLENVELSAYSGFLHENCKNHMTLVSDMIEEWRAVIVDSTILSLIQGNEIDVDMFEIQENGFCKIKNEGIKIFITKLEQKMSTEMNYLSYISKPISFRMALWHQVEKLVKAIENNNASIYKPIIIR